MSMTTFAVCFLAVVMIVTGEPSGYDYKQPMAPTYKAPAPMYETPSYKAPAHMYEAPAAYKAPAPMYEAPAYKAPASY